MRPTCPARCPPEIYSIMEKCWEIKPSARPNFTELRSMMRDAERQHAISGALKTAEPSRLNALDEEANHGDYESIISRMKEEIDRVELQLEGCLKVQDPGLRR